MEFDNYVIILVRPQIEENIGAVARVMMNFGFSKLFLVDPKCNWIGKTAVSIARDAKKILYCAYKLDSVEQAICDLDYAYALSARQRSIENEYIRLSNIPIHEKNKVGIIFGPENSGLSNEDVAFVDKMVGIDTSEKYKSLNLSKAVAIVCYEMSKNNSSFKKETLSKETQVPKKSELIFFFKYLKRQLLSSNFFRTEEKVPMAMLSIKSMFNKCKFNSDEIKTLYGMVRSLSSKKYDN
ncbi:MAG: hypothetical protein HRK26_00705 [Rickettsiaceae bacterium H1]|nr:hypothetical protein [Rickettsiaceae bacterium H1]